MLLSLHTWLDCLCAYGKLGRCKMCLCLMGGGFKTWFGLWPLGFDIFR